MTAPVPSVATPWALIGASLADASMPEGNLEISETQAVIGVPGVPGTSSTEGGTSLEHLAALAGGILLGAGISTYFTRRAARRPGPQQSAEPSPHLDPWSLFAAGVPTFHELISCNSPSPIEPQMNPFDYGVAEAVASAIVPVSEPLPRANVEVEVKEGGRQAAIPSSETTSPASGDPPFHERASPPDRSRAHGESAVALQSEFRDLLSQTLDLEEILEISLSFLGERVARANIALFLFNGMEEKWELGAYLTMDCPRRSIEPLIRVLGDEVSPEIASGNELMRFDDSREFFHELGITDPTAIRSQLVGWSCFSRDGQCLAVIYMFRDQTVGFSDDLADVIDHLRGEIAEQISRAIKIHLRTKSWPREPADDTPDES